MPDTITIIDDRTGKQVTVPITDGVFPATCGARARSVAVHLRPGVHADRGLQERDHLPRRRGTASSATAGTPSSSSPSTAPTSRSPTCCFNGELPNAAQLQQWKHDVTTHTFIHENMRKRFVDGFHYDAHPMGMLVSAIAALGTFYNDAKDIHDKDSRDKQILRLIAKMPTLAAMCYRFSVGSAVRLSRQRPQLPRQLLEHDVEDRFDTRSILGSSGRWTCCSSSTPTTSRTAARRRCASSGPAMPIRTRQQRRRHRRCMARCTAAPTKQVVRMLTDIGIDRQRAGVHRRGQGGHGQPPDGLRPPGVQELRPAGDDHQEDRIRRVRGHGQEPVARHRPEARRSRPQRRLLHRAASCTRTSTSTPA